jgi:MFS transporter, DHA2 family, multidrug resistance protein
MAVAGTGTGLAMAMATSAALGELTDEGSGVGSAMLQTGNEAGGPFGIAILGSVLSAARLSLLGQVGRRYLALPART